MIKLLSRKPVTSCCNFKRSWTKCTTQGLCPLLTQLFFLDQMTRSYKKMCRLWSCHLIVTYMTWQAAPWSQNLTIFRKRPQVSCMLGSVSYVLVPWAILKPYSDGLRNLTYAQWFPSMQQRIAVQGLHILMFRLIRQKSHAFRLHVPCSHHGGILTLTAGHIVCNKCNETLECSSSRMRYMSK